MTCKVLDHSIIVPASVSSIQLSNWKTDSKHHLCGSKESNWNPSSDQKSPCINAIISSSLCICEELKLEPLGVKIANNYFNKIGELIRPNDILEMCDRNMISHSSYDAFYKHFKTVAQMGGQGIRINCWPNP